MEVKYGGGWIPLTAIKLCGMGVKPNVALDICRNPHCTVG